MKNAILLLLKIYLFYSRPLPDIVLCYDIWTTHRNTVKSIPTLSNVGFQSRLPPIILCIAFY